MRNFLSGLGRVSFSGRILLHGVGWLVNVKEIDDLEGVGVDEKVILKCILEYICEC